MANVVLTPGDILDASRRIEDASERINASLQKLDVTMSDMDSVWNDANAKKYLEEYERLKETFPEFKASVRSYATFLNSVVETYDREYNEDVARRVHRIG